MFRRRGLLVSCAFGLTALASLGACDDTPPLPTTPILCPMFSEAECVRASICTLVLDEEQGEYSCRATADACEEGFRQLTDSQATCEAKPGCQFVPSDCYCPPGRFDCLCGGGPPATCQSAAG